MSKTPRIVYLSFLCLFLLLSAGRLSSSNATTQLQATMLLVNTGSLGTKNPPTETDGSHYLWVRNSHGYYYQCHDIGSIVLMLPAALIGSHLSHAPISEKIQAPPLLARFGVALTYAAFDALGCTFLFLTFSLFYQRRTAFLLSLTFALATLFCVYVKSAWDVTGSAVGICMLLYYSAIILTRSKIGSCEICFAAASLSIASAFRYSLLPFFLLGLVLVLILSRHKLEMSSLVAGLATLLLCLIPTLLYNQARMGSPFRPATTAAQFAELNSLTGNLFSGLYGLIASPNKGLLFFSPIFLLILALPLIWKRIALNQRQLLAIYGVCAALYLFMIAKMPNWGAIGWGPRYFIPILPVLFVAVSAVLVYSHRRFRPILTLVILLSLAVNIAPVTTNWILTSTTSLAVMDEHAGQPRQILAAWGGLVGLLRGHPLPAPPDILRDPIRSQSTRLPDFWIVYFMVQSHKALLLGALILSLLSSTFFWSFSRIMQKPIQIDLLVPPPGDEERIPDAISAYHSE